jgi:hypothetical protein
MQEKQSEKPTSESTQIEMETDVEGEDHAIVAMIDNRFVFKSETQRETSSEEVVGILKFKGPVAKVRRGYGLTLNLSNYESARLDVGVEVPCYLQDVDAADEWARVWVEERVVKEVENVRGEGSTKDKPNY